MKVIAAVLALLLPTCGLWFEGRTVLGRALLAAGWPSAAVQLLEDPAWRGAALYAAGRWQEAAEVFGAASPYNRGNALARAGRYAEAIESYDRALDADPDNGDAVFNKSLVAALLDAQSDKPTGLVAGQANSTATDKRQGSRLPKADGEASGIGSGYAGGQEGSSNRGPEGTGKVGLLGGGEQNVSQSGAGQARGSATDAAGLGRNGGEMVDVAAIIRARNRRIARMMDVRSVEASEEWLATLPDDPGQFLKLRIRAEQARRKTARVDQRDDD
jgi:Ca-activated chloride channel family protein